MTLPAFEYDSIPSASRRLAVSFLERRGNATESREVYAGDDLKDIPEGCVVEVVVRLIPPAEPVWVEGAATVVLGVPV